MTIVNDETVWNEADNTGDWTTSAYDAPQLNDSAATTPFYFTDGNDAAMEWPLKKGVTDGYTYCTITSEDVNDKVVVANVCYFGADITNIPITQLQFQYSSNTGFTSNYARINALTQIDDRGGWTVIKGYANQPDTASSPNYSAIVRAGLLATTGNNNDGKFGGFERMFSISYIGGHSEAVSLTDLYNDSESNWLFVIDNTADFFQFNVWIRLGDASATALTTFNEDGKTIFFDNLSTNHELGWRFINDTSGDELRFDLTNSSVSWNSGQTVTNEVFTDASNCDEFRISGCAFTNGGKITLLPHVSDSETYVQDSTFNSCQQIYPNSMIFRDNTINASANDQVDEGALLLNSTTVMSRITGLNFIAAGHADEHAIEIESTGTYDFTNFTYSGYGATGTDTAVIRNNSGGAVTINVVGGDTPSYQNGAGSTTTINNSVTVEVSGVAQGTSVKVIADETVGTITSGDVILEELADANGEASTTINYEGAFDPSGLDVIVRARNQGFPNAAIADDGGVLSDETTAANSTTASDMTLLPAAPAVGDAYYFGDSEEFPRLKLQLSQAGVGTWTITWEYWNGSSWAALSGVTDGTSGFTASGEVSWTVPGDWANTTVNSQGPFRYVRARLSAFTSLTTQPLGRWTKLDSTRYLPFTQNRVITSSGLSVVANQIEDTISEF